VKLLTDSSLLSISKNLQKLENLRIEQNHNLSEECKLVLNLAVWEMISSLKSLKYVIVDRRIHSQRISGILFSRNQK
jgi:hypothetical protein